MKYAKKILLSFALISLLGINLISAKGTTESEKQETGTPKLTILTNINVDTEGTDVNNNDYIKYVEQQVGVDIEFINETSSSNYPQKLNTMMASNKVPDIIMLMGTTQRTDLARLAEEEMLMPLDAYLKSYPNLKNGIKPASWELTKNNGSIYAVPFQRFDSTPFMTFMKRSWLENLNINPSTDLVTIEDWYNVLKRFANEDPDQNGKNDTYGLTSTTSGTHFTNKTFLDAFGAAKNKFVDGELLPYYILPEYKDWLKFMNKLYDERILDPNFIVDDPSTLWDKISATGNSGTFMWFWGLTEYLSKGFDRNDLVAVAPPVKQDGSEGHYIYSSPNRHMMAITTACENPEAAMKLFDWALSDEGGIFVYAGLENKDYDIIDGEIIIKSDRKGKNVGWRQLTLGVQNPNVDKKPLFDILVQSYGEQGMNDLNLANKCGTYNDLELYAPTFSELQKYDLVKSVQEYTDKAIIGAVDIDATWDNYVMNWKRSGGDEWIKLMTDWYLNSSLSK